MTSFRIGRFVLAGLAFTVGSLAAQGRSTPQPSPGAAVQKFMKAIDDSNITAVTELWGTNKGSAAQTGTPSDAIKHAIIMQAYLGGTKSKVVGEVPGEKRDQRLVTTEISRGNCSVTLSFRTVKYKDGWLVLGFDLDQASQVNRPCAGNGNPAG